MGSICSHCCGTSTATTDVAATPAYEPSPALFKKDLSIAYIASPPLSLLSSSATATETDSDRFASYHTSTAPSSSSLGTSSYRLHSHSLSTSIGISKTNSELELKRESHSLQQQQQQQQQRRSIQQQQHSLSSQRLTPVQVAFPTAVPSTITTTPQLPSAPPLSVRSPAQSPPLRSECCDPFLLRVHASFFCVDERSC